MLSFIFKNLDNLFILVGHFSIIYFGGTVIIEAIEKLPPFIRKKKNEKRIPIYNHIIQSLSPCVDFLREKDPDMISMDVARQMGVTEREVEKALEFLENEGIVEKNEVKGITFLSGPKFSYRLTEWFVANEFPSYFKYKASREQYLENYHKAQEVLRQNCKSMTLEELISD